MDILEHCGKLLFCIYDIIFIHHKEGDKTTSSVTLEQFPLEITVQGPILDRQKVTLAVFYVQFWSLV